MLAELNGPRLFSGSLHFRKEMVTVKTDKQIRRSYMTVPDYLSDDSTESGNAGLDVGYIATFRCHESTRVSKTTADTMNTSSPADRARAWMILRRRASQS